MSTSVYSWLWRSDAHEPATALRLPRADGERVLVTGGTGFVGVPLVNALLKSDYDVTVLTRNPARAERRLGGAVTCVPRLNPAREPWDIVINLAGEPLNGRWTTQRKERIVASRTETTSALHAAISKQARKPRVLINGSAIGWYGPQGDQPLDEHSAAVDSFSHELCSRWETEALRFESLGVRVLRLRLGVVLGRYGGALRELLRSFAFGAAVRLGSGRQWLSWIHLDDLIETIGFILRDDFEAGAVNVTAPGVVTHGEFIDTLRGVVGAPLGLTMPAPVVRAMFGQMGDELLLGGQRVIPARLIASGYEFRFPELEDALRDLLQTRTAA